MEDSNGEKKKSPTFTQLLPHSHPLTFSLLLVLKQNVERCMKEAIELIMETGRNKLENGVLWDKFTTFTMFLNYKTFAFSPFFIPPPLEK